MSKKLFIYIISLWCSSAHAWTIREAFFIKMCHFVPPLQGELYVSGNFGEPRPNHYHAGLDLKTKGSIGWKVMSAEDGHVSRIKVSATGYGNALYVDHPCGWTTVYAHLDKFVPEIQQWVKNVQYEKQSFEIDTILPDKRFQFARGQQIAFSGNTGGSAGPHLHFEVRDTKTEKVLNPMRLGFEVKDDTAPIIGGLKAYPIQKSFFDTQGKNISVKKISSSHWTADDVTVPEGKVAFSVQAYDQQNLTPEHKNGIPEIKMFVDGELVFHRRIDTIDFSLTKYTHAMVDYCDKVQTGKDFYLTTRLPGNMEAHPYRLSPSDGRISIAKDQERNIEIQLIDFHQNVSKLTFKVRGAEVRKDEIKYLSNFSQSGQKLLEGAEFRWEKESFYDWVPDVVNYSNIQSSPYSKTYYIAKREGIPFHQQVELQLMDWTAPTSLTDKLLLVGMNSNNRRKVFKTQMQGNRVIAQIHEPAEVYLTVDTIAPTIDLLNYNKATSSFPRHKMEVKITDDLSGIQSYEGYINQQWVLFEYDAKANLLTHTFDQDWKGENTLWMKVKDAKNNVAELSVKFKR